VEQGESSAASDSQPTTNAGIGAARIIVRRNGMGWYSFFLHVAIPVELEGDAASPSAVLGVTCVDRRYYWALRNLSGTVTRAGELQVPAHVRPYESVGVYSQNYSYEVARALCDLAKETHAFIGIDKTWEQRRVTALQEENKKALLHPDRQVADTLIDKVLEQGLIRPWFVYGVSPKQCGRCGHKIDNVRRWEQTQHCSSCGSTQLSSILPLPIAPHGGDVLWASLLWQTEDESLGHALTDFLAWIVLEANGTSTEPQA